MSRRLLLVDDDDSIRQIARLSLKRVGGWEVTAVGSGQAAIEAAGRGGSFDAVLLDVMMPGLDGPSTMRSLRAGPLGPEVPVVFLTAKLQPADRERLAELGAAGVIAKPFDPMTLAEQLDRILDGAGADTPRRAGERIHPEFATLWARRAETIAERVETISAAVAALVMEERRPEAVAAAISAAHQLSGSLGTFGLQRGSDLARELERGLEAGGPTWRLQTLAADLTELVCDRQPSPMR